MYFWYGQIAITHVDEIILEIYYYIIFGENCLGIYSSESLKKSMFFFFFGGGCFFVLITSIICLLC